MPGGRNNISELPEDLQKFYSNTIRKHTNYELPPGVVVIDTHLVVIDTPSRDRYTKSRSIHLVEIDTPSRDEHGFKVIIGEKSHSFISKHQSMEDKLSDAMECYRCITFHMCINTQKWNKDIVKDFDLVEGIKYRADKGWI